MQARPEPKRGDAGVMRQRLHLKMLKRTGTIWPATFDDDWCGEAVSITQFAQDITMSELTNILCKMINPKGR